MSELNTALQRLTQNPDFRVFEEYLREKLKLSTAQLIRATNLDELPVLQGRVQSFTAIIEELDHVHRKPRT